MMGEIMETISACPHHGFDTWMLVNHFYGGMSPAIKQLLETMCGGDFSEQHPDEAMDFLNYVAETSKGWDEPNPREMEKMRPSANPRGGIYALSEDMEMKARISTLARKVEELEGKRLHEVQAVTENPAQANPCTNFQSTAHPKEQYPMAPSVKDLMSEYANAIGQYKPPPPNAHMVIPTIPIGGITSTSPGNPTPLPMCPQVLNTVWFLTSTTTTTILFSCGTSHIELEQGGRQLCGGAEGDQCTTGTKD